MSAVPHPGTTPSLKRGAGSGSLRGGTDLLASEGAAPRSPLPQHGVGVRRASLSDVPALETLIAPFVATGDLLPRSRYDLCRHVKEYHVAVAPDGAVVGSCALKVYSLELAELAALAVREDWQSRGVGRALCEAIVAEARALGLTEVFALTRKPLFFTRLGFEPAQRAHFPLKVWTDCDRCPRKEACDEIAVSIRL